MSKTAVTETPSDPAAPQSEPVIVNGRRRLDPPAGFSGFAWTPAGAEFVDAILLDDWLTTKAPPELEKASRLMQEAYLRRGFVDISGLTPEITAEQLLARQYPATLARFIYDAADDLLSDLLNKKK